MLGRIKRRVMLIYETWALFGRNRRFYCSVDREDISPSEQGLITPP